MLLAMEPLITAAEQESGEESGSEAISFPWMDLMADNKSSWGVLAEEAKLAKAKEEEEKAKEDAVAAENGEDEKKEEE